MYNAALGRFMQTDPAGDTDSLNLYQYAMWDPITNRDPTGKFVPLIGAGIGAVTGYAVSVGFQVAGGSSLHDALTSKKSVAAAAGGAFLGASFGGASLFAGAVGLGEGGGGTLLANAAAAITAAPYTANISSRIEEGRSATATEISTNVLSNLAGVGASAILGKATNSAVTAVADVVDTGVSIGAVTPSTGNLLLGAAAGAASAAKELGSETASQGAQKIIERGITSDTCNGFRSGGCPPKIE